MMLNIFSGTRAKQLLTYVAIGLLSNSVGYILYLLLTYFGTTPKITMTFLYITGATIGYVGNKKLTFAHSGAWLSTGVKYAGAHALGYFVNLGLLVFFVDRLGLAHELVQAVAIFIVAAMLFILLKFFVFPTNYKSIGSE